MNDQTKPGVVPDRIEKATIGGVTVDVLDRDSAAAVMLAAAAAHPRGNRPLFFTSANGEVIVRINTDPKIAAAYAEADQILADGQSMVFASHWIGSKPLPERVATTDLFHDAARQAELTGQTFYMLGATPEENEQAVASVRRAYPRLNIVGSCHGFLKGEELEAKLAEINALAPDILWLGLGVPRQQFFVCEHSHKLPQVGLIKTCGGLFDFLSGKNSRAPGWMQKAGLEWAYRMSREPKRLFMRYLTTNPMAIYFMLTRSR